MNYIDIIVLILWALAAVWGFRSGLIQMIVPLAVVGAGLALSSRLAIPMGNLYASFITNENLQTVVGFGTIVFGLIIVAIVLSFLLKFILKFIPLAGLADSLGGAVVGAIIGFILVSGALVALQKFPVGVIQEDIDQSVVGNALADRFSVFQLIPDDWRSKAEDLKDKAQDAVPAPAPSAPQ
ncbi:MAG: CvpA family protein [Dehalococcoidia bacterium]|nr:CvpA family protein [Dehalococcoidia bacterium]MSQ17151.1 CvpA family protein [Dehalococcoidia bacterium]